jgi:hypothetical protein
MYLLTDLHSHFVSSCQKETRMNVRERNECATSHYIDRCRKSQLALFLKLSMSVLTIVEAYCAPKARVFICSLDSTAMWICGRTFDRRKEKKKKKRIMTVLMFKVFIFRKHINYYW